MKGDRMVMQEAGFYEFNLERYVPAGLFPPGAALGLCSSIAGATGCNLLAGGCS